MQARSPHAAAKEVLAELSIESPSLLRHLKEICVARGAYVLEKPLARAEGRLVVRGDSGIITVDPAAGAASPGRKRFSIAHELGHFELHRGLAEGSEGFTCDARDMAAWGDSTYRSRETEANQFASELLLPETFIRPAISAEEPGTGLLRELARDYGVSFSAALRRFIDLTEHACAAVFTREGRISHTWKSPLFARQSYLLPQGKLSPFTHAFRVHRGDGAVRQPRMAEVDAAAWLQLPHALSTRTLFEQSEYFRNLKTGVSLLWMRDPALLRH